jgi:shikimate kinase
MVRIFLIGPPGSGKTAAGKELASLLAFEFLDVDDLIESSQGMLVSEIFAAHGESYFRTLESQKLAELKAEPAKKNQVIATGGGLPVHNNNLDELLALGEVVALTCNLDVLTRRLEGDEKRPLLANKSTNCNTDDEPGGLEKRLAKLMKARESTYARAQYKIDTSELTPAQVARKIIQSLNLR